MGDLVGFFRQGLVVEIAGGFGVQSEVELVLPAEVEPGAGDRIVADLGGGSLELVTLLRR